jgi:hypothetical protein
MAEDKVSIIVQLKDEVSDGLNKIGEGFGDLFSSIGGGTIVAGAAIAELTKKIIDWTKEAGDAQITNLETVRVTEQVGTQAGWTATQVAELTKQISQKTGAEDTDLKAVANMVLVHENLSGKTFPQVMQAITDMAFVMGHGTLDTNSLSSAQHLLAAAMESPERAARMLKNSIVPLSDAAKAAIKDAMAHGDAEKARAVILDDVQKHIKGAAEQVGTYARSNNDLSTAFKGFAETVGSIFLPAWITIKETLATIVNSVSGVITIFVALSKASSDMTKLNFSHMAQYKSDIANAAFDVSATWKNLTKNIKAELDAQSKTQVDHAKKNHKAKVDDTKKLDADILAIQKQYQADSAAAKKDFDTKIVQLESAKGADVSRLKHELEVDLKTQDEAAKIDQMIRDEKFNDIRHKAAMDNAQKRIAIAENEAKYKKNLETEVHNVIGELASLQNSKNKDLFEIGKQAAVAQVLIKGAEAIMGFWATSSQLGPIAGPIFAGIETAAVIAIGAEQINQIESQSFPAAAGGAFGKGDGVNASFGEPGNPEAILNEPQLKSIINRAIGQAGGGSGSQINLVMDKQTMQRWSVQNSQTQYRLKKEGRMS